MRARPHLLECPAQENGANEQPLQEQAGTGPPVCESRE